MMARRVLQSLTLALAAVPLVHCYPLGYDYTDELDTVVTWRNKEVDFGALKTYDVPDSVADLCDLDGGGGAAGAGSAAGPGSAAGAGSRALGLGGATNVVDCHAVNHDYDDDILEAISRNMEELGYKRARASEGQAPDVVVLPGIVASEVWVVYRYYPWCGYYDPWYCYGWYAPTGSVGVQYPTGTIVMSMTPGAQEEPGEEPDRTLWVGGTHGLTSAGESRSSIRGRINKNIDQAFAQSPYLEVDR